MERIGLEAFLALEYLLGQGRMGVLEDGGTDYARVLESMDAAQLMAVVREATRLLEERRAGEKAPEVPPDRKELYITPEYRIYIGKPAPGSELLLRPMCKAVFVLYLRHPEGIAFKDVSDYREELESIYGKVSRFGDRDRISSCVDRLLNIESNELNVNVSRIAKGLAGHLPEVALPAYRISGRAGSVRTVSLDRGCVHWL